MDIIFDKITAETLSELEKTQKEFWNIPRKTGVLINTFIKMMNIQNALEIGTSNGYSGIWIGKALLNSKRFNEKDTFSSFNEIIPNKIIFCNIYGKI